MYDLVIIGAGVAGLMTAYTVIKNNPKIKILILEMGNTIEKRICPASKTQVCARCNPCNIMHGVSGSGMKSDGKLILSPSYGGILGDELGYDVAQHYIDKVDEMLIEFGDISKMHYPSDELKLLCLQHDMIMQQSKLKHLGNENNYRIMNNLIKFLIENDTNILTNLIVYDIIEKNNNISVLTNDGREFCGKKCIIATGRGGNHLVARYCENNNISVENNSVDIGIRFELPRIIWKSIEEKIYEPKIIYRTKKYGDYVRTFCFNGGGIVCNENTNSIVTVNGYSYSDEKMKSENSNFAILSNIKFTEPFNKPTEYVEHIARLANMIANGGTIVQRLNDLINGRRTTEQRLLLSSVKPTLKAIPGDISLVLPKRILNNILEMIYKLDEIVPGTANSDNLLYGVECKYYSVKPKHNKNFEINSNVYLIGDSSGISRSISQAGAMGVYLGEIISESW